MDIFSEADLLAIQARGSRIEDIEEQISHFVSGFPFINLVRPALAGDGIAVLSPVDLQDYCQVFEQQSGRYRLLKFVPASGAASRMFKDLFSFLENYSGSDKEIEDLLHQENPASVGYCLQHIQDFAFFPDLAESMKNDGLDCQAVIQRREFDLLVSYILYPMGLNYSNLPKGLLKFHRYEEGARTAIEEHLVEAAHYTLSPKGRAGIHFTLSPEHIKPFQVLLDEKLQKHTQKTGVTFNVTHSVQKPSTDTLAADQDNRPFRDDNGQLVFRPGGHGALIENLNELDQDIVFIKNIDNIVPDKLKNPTYEYKKALGGMLISLKQQADGFLDLLEAGSTKAEQWEIAAFCRKELMMQLPDELENQSPHEKNATLYALLNRPMRVCGMVRNQGEPGGGPFWVKDTSGRISLQIVESSQVDLNDPFQKSIFLSSTHFNPVDLVCHLRDHHGRKFDLRQFVDKHTGFISVKSKDGRELKAQELPGLWNGAMAGWISIFVEVPLITFNPVKVINDLLRETHR